MGRGESMILVGDDEKAMKVFLEICYEIVQNPETDAKRLGELWNEINNIPKRDLEYKTILKLKDVKCFIAAHLNAPVWVMREIAQLDDFHICLGLADNPNVDVVALEQMRTSSHLLVRRQSLLNENVTISMLKIFPRDLDEVYLAIAGNTATPLSLLEELAANEDPWVWLNLINNPAVPLYLIVSLLEKLTKSDLWVLWDWKSSLTITPQVLEEVLKDEFPEAHAGMPREWLIELFDATIKERRQN